MEITLIGTYSPRKCGIATFTKNLSEAIEINNAANVNIIAMDDEGSDYTYSDKVTVRIDFNINPKNTFNINYYYLKSWRNIAPSNSGAPGGSRQPSSTAMPFFASSYIINNNFNIIIGELNTRFNNKLSNKFQFGYNQLRDFRSSPGGIFPLVDIENGLGASFTSFGYEPFTAFNELGTDTWQLNDIVTLNKGSHTLTFGTQNTYNKFRNGFAPNYYGAYRFANLDSFYNSANNGNANASRYELRYSARKGGEFPFAVHSIVSKTGFRRQDGLRHPLFELPHAGLSLPTYKANRVCGSPA